MKGRDGRAGRLGRVLAAASLAAAACPAAHQRDAAPRQRHLRAQLAGLSRGKALMDFCVEKLSILQLRSPDGKRAFRQLYLNYTYMLL